jgi:predicted NAD-dependent protein-ADP-ribosyltransferase YbiA (DUF1768 family)
VEAKRFGGSTPDSNTWNMIKKYVLCELIDQKAERCEKFRTALLETESKTLAEATSNTYWASG